GPKEVRQITGSAKRGNRYRRLNPCSPDVLANRDVQDGTNIPGPKQEHDCKPRDECSPGYSFDSNPLHQEDAQGKIGNCLYTHHKGYRFVLAQAKYDVATRVICDAECIGQQEDPQYSTRHNRVFLTHP